MVPAIHGTTAVRYAKALGVSDGAFSAAAAYASSQNWKDERAIVQALQAKAAQDVVSATAAMEPIARDFSAFVMQATVFEKAQGWRRVPLNTRVAFPTTEGSASWTAPNTPKPVSAAAFNAATLAPKKVSALSILTAELVRSSEPNAEAAMSGLLSAPIVSAIHEKLLDPSNAGGDDVPASITSGVTPIPSSGSDIASIDADLSAAIDALSAVSDLSFATWLMSARTLTYLARLRGTGDALAYPNLSVRGSATLAGLPVIAVPGMPMTANSPSEGVIVLVDPRGIAYADSGESAISVSRQGSVQLDDAPNTGAQALVSLWQSNLVAYLLERFLAWQVVRAGSAQAITGVNF